jgi:hypothetical protein
MVWATVVMLREPEVERDLCLFRGLDPFCIQDLAA